MTTERSVLITGCSSGIGRATAERFARRGWRTWATARRPETITDLRELGAETLPLDVTDEDSMRSVVDAAGAVDVLVNNAGYALEVPVEQATPEQIRRQFETNVFGLTRLTQLVLPAMRERREGRIVNVSSMGGRLVLPAGGYYHGTKWAVEAISDALRFEVAPFGIRVSVVEPGVVRTRFGDNATMDAPVDGEDPYAELKASVAQRFGMVYEGPLGRLLTTPAGIARKIEHAATARRPKTRYRVGPDARAGVIARRLAPDRVWDAALRLAFRHG